MSAFLQQGWLYNNSFEEKVVVATLASEGKMAALLITGWGYLEAEHLDSMKPSGGSMVSVEGEEYRVGIVGEKGAY